MSTKPTRSVRLDPMTEDEFVAWLVPSVRAYAQERVISGGWSERDALEYAKNEFMTLLPNGVNSGEQHLLTVRVTEGGADGGAEDGGAGNGTDESAAVGANVGAVWIGMRLRAGMSEAYVYNIVIDEAQRGKGYGRAAMLAAIEKSRELGAASVGLHVFGHNTSARSLYRSLGFVETNVSMSFSLEDGEGQVASS
jgi:ribosomal protein S18 acetylase RimI-like enzyme